MNEVSLFALILKQTKTWKFLGAFAITFLICTLLLWLVDPSLKTYMDALWYGFMLVTTVGFGDLTATNLISRLISVFLGLYGVLAIGFICGVGASWLFEKIREGRGESVARMIDQLEHLEDLDDHQLAAIQQRAQKITSFNESPQAGEEAHSASK